MKKKVALNTLGCKLNYAETSYIAKEFLQNGYEIVEFNNFADVYVLNTCTVTENAERECRQIVRRARRKNPGASIIVTGCYAQLRPKQIAEIDGVDLVLGNDEKFDISNYNLFDEKGNLSCINVTSSGGLKEFHPAFSSEADNRTRAFLKIQDGCDYKCSFCTIPLARGSSRSANPGLLVDQFKKLLDNGYKEIVLTGVNIGDYGKNVNLNFYELLEKFVQIKGKFRIRISSIEPNLLTNDILQLTKENEKICNHFHIPLQSGSNDILKLMHRRYKREDYEKLIYKAKEIIPDLGIGVDVIVGFPGETKRHFMETYNFLQNLPVEYLHVFTYSERPFTKAIEMPGKIEIPERKRRNNLLRSLSDKKRNEFNKSFVNKEVEVLFETGKTDGFIYGFTSNYIRVKYPFKTDLVNNFKKVIITSTDNNICSAVENNPEYQKQEALG